MRISSQVTFFVFRFFGPGVPLLAFDTEREAVQAANDTSFSLAWHLYSEDVRWIDRGSRALEAGIVGMNGGSLASEAAPFGGVRESGNGRQGSK